MDKVYTSSALIDPNDVVMLFIEHQSGLFSLVKEMSVSDLSRNVTALAKVAALQKIPAITTASVPEGPNGPLIPEIHRQVWSDRCNGN